MNLKSLSLTEFVSHLSTMSSLEYIIDILPKCSKDGPWIAGGCLHRTYKKIELDSDIDIFFSSEQQMNAYVQKIIIEGRVIENAPKGKYENTSYFVNRWHQTLNIKCLDRDWKIQCVTFKYFKDISELFDSFDMTMCMMAYDGENVYMGEDTMTHIINNNIHFNVNSINFPSVTLKRLVKYMKMGYNVEENELKHLSDAFYKSSKKNRVFSLDELKMKNMSMTDSDYKNLSP